MSLCSNTQTLFCNTSITNVRALVKPSPEILREAIFLKRTTTLQLLLDLAHEGGHDVQSMTLADLITYLDNDGNGHKIAKATDRKFNSHRYPADKITFTRLSTLDQVPGITQLSDTAARVLLLLCQSMGQSCCVRGTTRSLADSWGLERSKLQRGLRELIDYGYIAQIKQGKGRGTVSVYMVNPRIAQQGSINPSQQSAYNDLCPELKQKLDLPNNETIDIGRETIVTSKFTLSPQDELDTTQDKLYASTVKRTQKVIKATKK